MQDSLLNCTEISIIPTKLWEMPRWDCSDKLFIITFKKKETGGTSVLTVIRATQGNIFFPGTYRYAKWFCYWNVLLIAYSIIYSVSYDKANHPFGSYLDKSFIFKRFSNFYKNFINGTPRVVLLQLEHEDRKAMCPDCGQHVTNMSLHRRRKHQILANIKCLGKRYLDC